MSITLSIIIPVYNLQHHLSRCLDSVLSQDFPKRQYEVILVNDGSTDGSKSVMESYARKFDNFLIIDQDNQGVSVARNAGIIRAKGDYLYFVDGDDWLSAGILIKFYEEIFSRSVDIGVIRYNLVSGDVVTPNYAPVEKMRKEVCSGVQFLNDDRPIRFYPWLFPVSRKLIVGNNLFFDKRIKYCEDKLFFCMVLLFARSVKMLDTTGYNYVVGRSGSASMGDRLSNVRDTIRVHFAIYAYLLKEQEGHNPQFSRDILECVQKSYRGLSSQSVCKYFFDWNREIRKYKAFYSLNYRDNPHLFLLRINPALFYIFYYFPRAVYHKLCGTS
jgi:glycosyltransferase involved in cell wall biosynthesis